MRSALLLLSQVVQGGASASNCVLTVRPGGCKNFPEFGGTQFNDHYGEELLSAGEQESYCLRRAEDFHHWCGNGRSSENATVAATYVPEQTTQIYHPNACPNDWSLYHKNCYIHVWRSKTWWDAEAWCNMNGAHLCSIHGKAENGFVFTLTKGLTSWIGYEDVDQDEEYKWSDNTKSDYENRETNCTGRELEPDCQPQEKAQQWYDWNGADRSTYVCKKPAKFATALIRNTTSLEELPLVNWEKFKKEFPTNTEIVEKMGTEEEEEEALPTLNRKKIDLGKKKEAKKEDCPTC